MPGKTAKKSVPKAAAKTKPALKLAAKSIKSPTKKVVTKMTPTKPSAKKPAAPAKPQAKGKTPDVGRTPTPQASPAKRTTTSDQFSAFTPYKEKRGEEYMNPEQVEHFRNILEAWKHDLMEKVDETVHHMQDEAANFPDPNDRASQESDFTMELRARDRERKLIKKIEEALQGLDDNAYGFCESCGVEIGIRRLEARPTATLCIDCKELDEIRERQSKG